VLPIADDFKKNFIDAGVDKLHLTILLCSYSYIIDSPSIYSREYIYYRENILPLLFVAGRDGVQCCSGIFGFFLFAMLCIEDAY